MSAAKHTPGPWPVGEYEEDLGYDCLTGAVQIGTKFYLDGKDYGQQRCKDIEPEALAQMMADAHLIGAAPDLLAALQHSQGILNHVLMDLRMADAHVHPNLIVALRNGREAIAKALGEAAHG